MSFGKKFGIQAAMEELDQAATTDEVVEMPADEETVDTAMAEVTEAAADVEGGTDGIEEAVTDVETLADVADTMEASEETGGLDDKGAAVAEVAIEALYERLHVTRRKAMPAMEAFGSQSNRKDATRIAVEGIRDEAKKVWTAIAAMAAKVWEFIKGFLKSIFDASTKLREKAEKLKKAVDSVKGRAESATLENTKLGDQLSLGGKVTMDGVLSGANSIIAESDEIAGAFKGVGEGLAGADFASFIKDAAKFDSFDATFPTPELKKAEGDKYGKAPEGTEIYVSTEYLGNRIVKLVTPSGKVSGAAFWAAAANAAVTIEQFDAQQKPVTSVPTLDPAEMTKILEQVVFISEAIDKLKPELQKAEEATGKLVSATRKAAVMNIAEDKDAFARGRAVSKAVSKITSLVTRPGVLVTKQLVDAGKAELEWVVKSAAQYKGNEASKLSAPEKKDEA